MFLGNFSLSICCRIRYLSTAAFTLSTYAHSSPGMKKENDERMGQYIKSLRSGTG